MTEKTEALRLAEQLEAIGLHGPVAAELRRLSAENDRLQACYEACRIAAHQWLDKTEWIQKTARDSELGMHRADVVRQRLSAVEAQRDALLEALKEITPSMPPVDAPCHYGIVPQEKCGHCGRIAKARAAIKAVEGETNGQA